MNPDHHPELYLYCLQEELSSLRLPYSYNHAFNYLYICVFASLLESQCRRTSSDLETQHLDTLKHICQTHNRSVCVCVYVCVYSLHVAFLFVFIFMLLWS